jgi:hypothetical protein
MFPPKYNNNNILNISFSIFICGLMAIPSQSSVLKRRYFLLCRRAPQQMLRTHRSLKGLLCNPVMKMKRKMISLFFYFSKYWSSGGMKLTAQTRSTRGKTCPSATLSTTNPTWTDLGSSPGLRGGRPATNRLSQGTTLDTIYKLSKNIRVYGWRYLNLTALACELKTIIFHLTRYWLFSWQIFPLP